MKINYFGIENSIINDDFKNPNGIVDLILNCKNNIIFNNIYPCIGFNNGSVFYCTKDTCIGNNIFLRIEGIYDYGIVYKVFTNDSHLIKTSAKFIIGNNVASFVIDDIDEKYNENNLYLESLKENFEKEKVLINSLGDKISINKLYGKRSGNKFLKIIETRQIQSESEIVENAIYNSINVLEESLNEKRGVRIRRSKI